MLIQATIDQAEQFTEHVFGERHSWPTFNLGPFKVRVYALPNADAACEAHLITDDPLYKNTPLRATVIRASDVMPAILWLGKEYWRKADIKRHMMGDNADMGERAKYRYAAKRHHTVNTDLFKGTPHENAEVLPGMRQPAENK